MAKLRAEYFSDMDTSIVVSREGKMYAANEMSTDAAGELCMQLMRHNPAGIEIITTLTGVNERCKTVVGTITNYFNMNGRTMTPQDIEFHVCVPSIRL